MPAETNNPRPVDVDKELEALRDTITYLESVAQKDRERFFTYLLSRYSIAKKKEL